MCVCMCMYAHQLTNICMCICVHKCKELPRQFRL